MTNNTGNVGATMKLKFGRRSLAVVLALTVVVVQLGRSEPPVNAAVFVASSESGYAEIWVPHQQFTGGITNVNSCADTKANNSWYIEPVAGCPKTVSVTLPGDTTTATSAELYLDIWAGRESHIVRYSINGGTTRTVNAGFDASRSPVVLSIPVAELQNGSNDITFSVNNSKYHIHDASIRLYGVAGSYADTGSLATVGAIAAGTGGTLDVTTTETVTITATVPGADRVEFIAYYDGLDEDNDGDTTDWHAFTRMNFQPGGKPNSGYSIPATGGTIGHIGTDLNDGDDNYSIDWDTSLVASQSGVKIKARAITEASGTRLDVVDAVGGESGNFTISRSTYIVEYFRDNDFVDGALREGGGAPDQLTRDMNLPADQTDWQSATMLGLFWGAPDITWNGGTTERAFTFLNNGNAANDDVWDVSVVELDLNDLVGGQNDIVYDFDAAAFPFGNQVEEPGPLLVVKRAGSVQIYDQPDSRSALDGQPVTLDVVASGLGTITYQWTLDNVDIVGATGSSYSFAADIGDGVSQDYRVEVTAGGTVISQVATVAVIENAFVADDFSDIATSQALWDEVDATGGATFTYTGAQAIISIPEDNESHQPWIGGNDAGVLRQPMSDTDFDLHAAFESVPSERFTLQGVVVGGSGNPYLRFDVYFDGTDIRPFAAAVDGNNPITFINGAPLSAAEAKHIRVRRVGDQFTMFTSADGTAWTQRGQFTYTIDVVEFGPFGGTALDTTTAPEFHAIVDFVVEVPDGAAGDDGADDDSTPAVISDIQVVAGATTLIVSWTTSEPTLGSVSYVLNAINETRASAGLSLEHSVQITGLAPETTYDIDIDAEDINANASATSVQGTTSAPGVDPTVFAVWYGDTQDFGQMGIPQRWINILGRVSDAQGIDTLTYSLNGAPAVPMQIGPDGRRLHGTGDFNADILTSDLQTGANTVVFIATDATASVTQHSVTVNWTPGVEWDLPFVARWADTTGVSDASQPVDGLWSLSIDGLTINNVDDGYDRLTAIGDLAWDEYEVTVPVTVNSIGPNADESPSNGPGVGFILRWQGHNDSVDPGSQPQVGFKADGGVTPTPFGSLIFWRDPVGPTAERIEVLDENASLVASDDTFALDVGEPYILKARVEGTTPATYSFKAWKAADAEPAGWNVTWTASGDADEPTGGSLTLLSHEVDATFGDVVVTPAGATSATPNVVSPGAGIIDDSTLVSMTSPQAGATIFYTTDGSVPTASSTKYTGPFTLADDATIKSVSMVDGHDPSAVVSTAYTVNSAPVAEAGSGSTIELAGAASLAGSFTDDAKSGSAVTVAWTKVSGPGGVTFADSASAATTATFDEGGNYLLEIEVNDGRLTSTDTVTITVNVPASVIFGYWITSDSGQVLPFGDVAHLGDLSGSQLAAPVSAIDATPERDGYWLALENGDVKNFGNAQDYGNVSDLTLAAAVVGMTRTGSGGGYYLLGQDGGIFAFGDANFYGSTGAIALDKPITAMAAAPGGEGYWFAGADGGMFAFGPDAPFFGSVPGVLPAGVSVNEPVVGMAPTASGNGYWLVAADGGLFAFGDAQFFGSIPGVLPPGAKLAEPIVGMVATASGNGYWLVARDGGVFGFGDAAFVGSGAGQGLSAVVGLAS